MATIAAAIPPATEAMRQSHRVGGDRRLQVASFCTWDRCRGMQRLEKSHKGRGLRRIEIFSVGGHVAAALEYLAYKLIASQANSDGIKGRAPLSTDSAERVAIVALLFLKHQCALDLKRCASAQELRWNGSRGRCIHYRAPRRMFGHVGKSAKRYGDKQDRQHCDRTPLPTFLALARNERQPQENNQRDHGANQQNRGLELWRKQR